MNPAVIAYGLLIFSVCFAVHIIVWRIRLPWVSSLVLVFIFLVVPAIALIIALSGFSGQENLLSMNIIELLEVFLLHFALSSAYIATYPAVRAVSPSLDILLMVSRAKDGKMTEDDIVKNYTDLRLIVSRIDDLMEYRLVVEREGRFELRPLARIIITIFIFYRKLLGLPMGQG